LFRAAGAGLLVVIEPLQLRRDVAKRMGADVCLDPSSEDPRVLCARRPPERGRMSSSTRSAINWALRCRPSGWGDECCCSA
jgi:threonine dehydrogenase-like Zn-dependent dehydrogenase